MAGSTVLFGTSRSRICISIGVSATLGSASGQERRIIVIQNTRQATIQKTEISLVSRSAVRSLASSALQPDFRILWKTSIFHRRAYQRSFSAASAGEPTGRSVISFQSILGRPIGSWHSLA